MKAKKILYAYYRGYLFNSTLKLAGELVVGRFFWKITQFCIPLLSWFIQKLNTSQINY